MRRIGMPSPLGGVVAGGSRACAGDPAARSRQRQRRQRHRTRPCAARAPPASRLCLRSASQSSVCMRLLPFRETNVRKGLTPRPDPKVICRRASRSLTPAARREAQEVSHDPAQRDDLSPRNRFSAAGRRLVRGLAVPGRAPAARPAAGYELTVLVDGVPAPHVHATTARPTCWASSGRATRCGSRTTRDGASRPSCRSTAATPSTASLPTGDRSAATWFPPGARSTSRAGGSRTSQAAAFRFSSVPDSYAARTGSAREVGVIGVAVFPERVPPAARLSRRRRPPYRPYPRRRRRYRRAAAEAGRAPSAKNEKAPPGAAPAPSTPPARRPRAMPPARPFERARQGVGAEAQPYARRIRPGLGTEYGEAVDSPHLRGRVRSRQRQHPERGAGCPLQRSRRSARARDSRSTALTIGPATTTRTTTAICGARPTPFPVD